MCYPAEVTGRKQPDQEVSGGVRGGSAREKKRAERFSERGRENVDSGDRRRRLLGTTASEPGLQEQTVFRQKAFSAEKRAGEAGTQKTPNLPFSGQNERGATPSRELTLTFRSRGPNPPPASRSDRCWASADLQFLALTVTKVPENREKCSPETPSPSPSTSLQTASASQVMSPG